MAFAHLLWPTDFEAAIPSFAYKFGILGVWLKPSILAHHLQFLDLTSIYM
jgi:hypothetical protein